jgi:hypothetical protein
MLLAAVRKICRAGTRHQIAIEPAAAGYSPFRDFVHCRFADAGRRWVWLRSPTAGIRKPSQGQTNHHPCRRSLRATAVLPATDQVRKFPLIGASCQRQGDLSIVAFDSGGQIVLRRRSSAWPLRASSRISRRARGLPQRAFRKPNAAPAGRRFISCQDQCARDIQLRTCDQ